MQIKSYSTSINAGGIILFSGKDNKEVEVSWIAILTTGPGMVYIKMHPFMPLGDGSLHSTPFRPAVVSSKSENEILHIFRMNSFKALPILWVWLVLLYFIIQLITILHTCGWLISWSATLVATIIYWAPAQLYFYTSIHFRWNIPSYFYIFWVKHPIGWNIPATFIFWVKHPIGWNIPNFFYCKTT